MSILQGVERARNDLTNVHQHLAQSVEMAASSEGNILASGEQILRSLANIEDVRDITSECNRTLTDALIGVHFLTNLSRVDSNGTVVCSAHPQARGMRIGKTTLFQSARETMAFTVSGQLISPVTRTPIIGAMLPLRDSGGRFAGTVALGVKAQWLDFILRARDLPKGAVVSVFDRMGAIITTNNKTVSKAIFSTMPHPETLRGALESRADARGNMWTFSAAPLLGNNIFVGFAMRESRLLGPTYLGLAMDFLLPVFMIALAWGGIWFATDRQVTRWIEYLRRVAAAYRGGHYRVRPSLEQAPVEFKLLGNAMKDMAESIEDRDRNLREAINQKTRQIRETHHRVKNNLQVVMSLLSLQAAQSGVPEVRDALSHAQARINALALVHRSLNQIEDQTSVDLRTLLEEIVRQTVGGVAVDRGRVLVTVEVLPISVAGEIAVPIALFTVEAIANAFKHAFPAERPTGKVGIELRRQSEDSYSLVIEDDGIGFSSAKVTPGVGERLLKVFGRQVQGTIFIDSQPNRGTRVELTFALTGRAEIHGGSPRTHATKLSASSPSDPAMS